MINDIKPGIYPDVSIQEYHDGPGLSNSGIKMLLDCPKKYHHYYIMKNRGEPSKAMLEGNQFHTYVLERDKFYENYFVSEKITRRGDKWRDVVDAAQGKEIIFRDRKQQIVDMEKSLMSFPRAKSLLSGGIAESSMYWVDEDTGVLCKSRPDYLNADKKFITDLKTTENASYSGFSSSIAKYNYHVQAAMMIDGFKAVTGEDIEAVFNFAIEKSAPYCAAVYMLNEKSIEIGRKTYKHAIKIFAKNNESGDWDSYSNDIEEIQIPYWATKESEEE